MNNRIAAIDFDGTLVEGAFPGIGKPIDRVINFVNQLVDWGYKLILWTCRTGERLEEAVAYCRDVLGIEFDAVNENLPSIIEAFGSDPRKIVAEVYVDDRAINALDVFVRRPDGTSHITS